MNNKITVGYYYHVCVVKKNNKIYLPSYLSVFFDELAKQVDKLVLFLYEANNKSQIESADCFIEANNIIWVNLGKKTSAWYRGFFANNIIRNYKVDFDLLDYLIIRSPTPLAPFFKNFNWLKNKLVYMIVSDYKKGAEMIPINNLRNLLVRYFILWNDRKFKNAIKSALLIVNSKEIYDDHKQLSKTIFELKTTTLRKTDFHRKLNQKFGNTIKLLFTGRIVLQKGLIELVDCLKLSENENFNLELHIVGWEEFDDKPFESELKAYAKTHNIKSKIIFHGLKSVGDELNAMYRMADIYVLPSHHEGFPRTIWEAMANSIPVISTNVGSIPHYINNNEHALLVPPKNSLLLFDSIKQMIINKELRDKLVENSHNIVINHTLEFQTEKLMQIIKSNLSD